MTGVVSHASMSEKSRLESLEKQIVALTRCVKDLAKVVEENVQDISSQEDHIIGQGDDIAELQDKIDALGPHISRTHIFPKPDSGSETELSD